MITEEQIRTIVDTHYQGTDKFLVEVHVRPTNRVTVFIDGDTGISVSDCHHLNRHIESLIDRENEDYDLTVSSFGADKPLVMPRQYPRHIGRELSIRLSDDTIVTGKLIGSTDSTIEIEPKRGKKEPQKPNVTYAFSDLKQVRIILSFK